MRTEGIDGAKARGDENDVRRRPLKEAAVLPHFENGLDSNWCPRSGGNLRLVRCALVSSGKTLRSMTWYVEPVANSTERAAGILEFPRL